MYICVCNAVSCKRVKQALNEGMQSVHELRLHFGFESVCGKCNRHMRSMINEHHQSTTGVQAGETYVR